MGHNIILADDHGALMKPVTKTILLCVIAEIGNIISSFIVAWLKLPCFLDTVFSVAITFYAGLVPGLIVAGLFNPVMMVLRCSAAGVSYAVYDCLYAICGMLIVFATWLFSRNKREFLFSRTITVLYLLIIVLFSSFLSFFTATALDTFVQPLFHTSTGFSVFDNISGVLRQLKMGTFLSYLVPRIPLTVLDRLVSTFAAFGLYKLMVRLDNHKQMKDVEVENV